jgi:hypothetical protein
MPDIIGGGPSRAHYARRPLSERILKDVIAAAHSG